jgi:hypothetical protein
VETKRLHCRQSQRCEDDARWLAVAERRCCKALSSYAGTLQEDRRVLLQRYALQDVAFGEFAMAYADQTDRDWNAFLTAIKAGRIVAGLPA